MNLDVNNVVIEPVLTEKTITMREELSKYVFKVHKHANKIQIKKALESLYDVSVKRVNILNTKSKSIRFRYRPGRKSGYKKAIVTLSQGRFDFFEGV